MALPTGFLTPKDYFRDAIHFLQAHSWIYSNANTRFISAGVLEQFPAEYQEYFLNLGNSDLNKFPFLHENDLNCVTQPMALRRFRSTLCQLIPKEAYNLRSDLIKEKQPNLPKRPQRKMSAKKQHEITELSKVIYKTCHEMSLLLDFGAGLGYLSESLFALNSQWGILGLEADEYRVAAARKRLQQQLPEAGKQIMYVKQFINANAGDAIEQHIARGSFADGAMLGNKWAIIGLHACGDLAVVSIELFFKLRAVKRLAIMPCCYHKLQQTADGHFSNFPLSAALKSVTVEAGVAIESYLNRPFLRLACQETSARWRNSTEEEHSAHGREMFWRSVADAIINHEREMISLVDKSQRPSTVNCDLKSFANFCQIYEVRSKDAEAHNATCTRKMWNAEHERRFNEIVERYAGKGLKLTEALTCLQTTLQKLCENIVLYDRICYMQELAEDRPHLKVNLQYQKILDEQLSPRCYVLIAEKFEP